jgi:integrative and conjugative element protein (TIGR02256 family)
VLVQRDVCQQLDESCRTCKDAPEAGGILLGCYRGGDLHVTERTLPGPTDGRHRLAFVRVDPLHQTAASRLWTSTGGTHTFVGEWHTHPAGGITPSTTDLRSWTYQVRRVAVPLIFALAVPDEWGLFIVRPSWLRKRALRLSVIENGTTGLVFGG